MGREATAIVRIDGVEAESRVLLETTTLICRGGHKRTFSHDQMKGMSAKRGSLAFECNGEKVEIQLGDAAEAWADAIKNPRTRAQKLGIKAGMKCVIVGKTNGEDLSDVTAALEREPSRRLSAGIDLALYFATEKEELSRLDEVEAKLASGGAVWVLWPKGRKDFAHEDVVKVGKKAGLVQTKSVGFSDALSGLRLTRPAKH